MYRSYQTFYGEAIIRQFIENLLKRKEQVEQIRQAIKRRPFELLKKAEKALEKAREACSSKDVDMFEGSIVLFANYSRAAADASTAALMMWLLDCIEHALDSLGISSILHARPEVEKLGLLLSDTSFKELRKIAVLLGLGEAEERLKSLERKYERLREHPCWRLRNALAHGWPYQISIEYCSVTIPERSVTLGDMEGFLELLNEYLKEVAALINNACSKTRG